MVKEYFLGVMSRDNEYKTETLDIDELGETAVRIYMYLVSEGGPRGVREIARDLNIPVSTVHYNLKRLEKKGFIKRVDNGYVVDRIVKIRGFVIIGRFIMPRYIIYSLFFLGVLLGYSIRLLILGESINIDKLITIVTAAAALTILLHETKNLKKLRIGVI